MTANVTRDRCRQIILEGLDWSLNHRWLSGLDAEKNAILMGCRAVISTDDEVVDKIVTAVGPYSVRHVESKIEGEVQSIDFGPGRKDGMIGVLIKPRNDYGKYVTTFVTGPGCSVQLDGLVSNYLDCLLWVATNRCRVKVTTDDQGIGYLTEFFSIKEAS